MTGFRAGDLVPRRTRSAVHQGRLLAVVLSVLLAGCSPLDGLAGAESPGGPDWPPTVPEVTVTLQDDAIELDRRVPSGRVVFRVHNAGTVRHRVTLIPLPDDLPPLEEQLAGDERRSVSPLGATNTHPPGEGTAFAVDLEPSQRYGLVCFEKTDDGTVHARTGENAEFRTGDTNAGNGDGT